MTPGTGRLSGCTLGGASDQIQPGQTLTATCTYSRGLLENGVEFRITAPSSATSGAASGWQVQLTAGSTTTGWVSNATTITVPAPIGTSGFTFTIALRAPANAVAGVSNAASTVSAHPCGLLTGCTSTANGTATISASVAPLGSDDMSMTCSPTGPLSLPRASSGTFTCRVNALAGLGSSSLIVRSVTIPAAPAGWTMTTSPVGTTGAGGAVTISPNHTIPSGGTWSFTVTLSPSCTASASASWAITSQVANTNGTLTSANVAGPSASYAANATAATQTISTVVVSGSLNWSFPYSFEAQTGTGQVIYRVTGAGCSGWNASIVASPFRYTGPGRGTSIPADNLGLTAVGQPVALSGSASGVTPGSSTGGLGTTRKVMSAQAGSGNGTYEQTLDVSFTLPAGANVGSYRSTITITTAAGP